MQETPTLQLTADQKQKMRSLRAMLHTKKEEARRYNYMRPQAKNHMREFERFQRRAHQRVEGVIMGLMNRYATEQGIEFEEIQQKIAEDPTLLENFYIEAVAMIPEHYLPVELANDVEKFVYRPYRQGGRKGVPYVRTDA